MIYNPPRLRRTLSSAGKVHRVRVLGCRRYVGLARSDSGLAAVITVALRSLGKGRSSKPPEYKGTVRPAQPIQVNKIVLTRLVFVFLVVLLCHANGRPRAD